MNNDTRPTVSGKYLKYRGKPLVREGNTICYGDMNEACILVLEIMAYKKHGDGEIPSKVLIQVIDSKNPNKIIKQGQKDSMCEAFSIGVIWLERALAQ